MIKEKLSRHAPKTDNPLVEGGRLARLNAFILIIAVALSYGVLWLIDRVRKLGIPLPLPVWLLMLLVGIPYFVIWFEYGRAFGAKLKKPNFLKGLVMGIIGQIPGFLLYYIMTHLKAAIIDGELLRVIRIIFRTFIVIVPIMAALGSLDIERDSS